MQNLTKKQQEKLSLIDLVDEQLIQGNIDDLQHEEYLEVLREE